MNYTITVFQGLAMQTIYDGPSYKIAHKTLIMVRDVLILASGTATLYAQYNNDETLYPLWVIKDGMDTPQLPLRTEVVITP